MDNLPKIMFWIIGVIIGITISLYLSSIIYFLLNGFDPDNALPWSIFEYMSYTHKPYGMYLAISLITPNVLLGGVILMMIFKPVDRNSRWAKHHDLKKANMLKKQGLILGHVRGQLLINDGDTHAFIIAPTRSGKGVGVVIPNLLAWDGSFICLDVKGENYKITSGFRKSLGHKVINFSPFAKDQKSHCYNPLDYVSKDKSKRITDLQIIASSLISISERADPHFPEEAQDLFVGLALYVIDNKEFPSTIGAIFRLLGTQNEFGELLKYIAQTHPELDEPAKQLFNSFSSKADKEKSGIKSTLGRALKLWRNPAIDAVTAKSDFDLRELRTKRHAIYLGIGVSEMAVLAPIMRLFFEQAVTLLTEHAPDPIKEPHKVLLLMDEFHILGKMPVMASAFTLMAGFNVRLMGIVQNIGLLDEVYSKNTRDTILSNCAHQIFFATTNVETQKYISAACGECSMKSKSISKARGFATEKARISVSEKIVPLIRPHEINTQLGAKQSIILVEKNHPVKCSKILYYKNKILKQRLLPPVPTPDLAITQEIAPEFDIANVANQDEPQYTDRKYSKRKEWGRDQQPEKIKKPNIGDNPAPSNNLNSFLK